MQNFKEYLNPIHKRIEDVVDLSNVETENKLKEQEYEYLEMLFQLLAVDVNTGLGRIDRLDSQLEIYVQQLETETGDDKFDVIKMYNSLMKEMEHQVNQTNIYLQMVDSPYFGKIKFHRKESEKLPEKKIVAYLGKSAYVDSETSKPLITDWRAPIANLYYENTGPASDVTLKTPAGDFKGDLTQKMQFQISNGRINSVYESKSGNAAADEFLLSQLNERIGQKLQDIVSTIQAQQNQIIREDVDFPVFIQGVAGSGKTTIILHRLAYLFFTYEQDINPENSLILAPNNMFLDYISDVLPSLGINQILQNTYLFWARDVLGFDQKYQMTTTEDDLAVIKFKGTKKYMDMLDRFFNLFEEELFEHMPGGSLVFDIQERYYEMLAQENNNLSRTEVIDLSISYAFAQKKFKKKSKYIGSGYANDQLDKDKERKIKSYIKKQFDTYHLYQEFTKRLDISYADIHEDANFIKHVLDTTKEQLKGNSPKVRGYKKDDLAGLVWLHFKLHNSKDNERDYVVVDEAQDLSFFQLVTLTEIAKNNNITIAGDVAQAIHPPFHIQDWQQVIENLKQVFNLDNVSYHQLNRCYRTTIEIITYANKIFAKHFPDSYKLPEAVLRHGDEVTELETAERLSDVKEHEEVKDLINIINEQADLERGTCALLCRDINHARAIYKTFEQFKDQLKYKVTNFEDDDFTTGLLVLPVARAKGLEFDTVIIVDVDDENYPIGDANARLLYVAVTRALHKLVIHKSKAADDSGLLDLA